MAPTYIDSELAPELAERLDHAAELLVEDPAAARAALESLPESAKNHLDAQSMLAAIDKLESQFEAARERLNQLLQAFPEDADLHYQLADTLEDAGDSEAANAHFLRTLELDQSRPSERTAGIERRIDAAVRETLSTLPPDFKKRFAHVPVFLEERPTLELVAGGLDPRSLGLFDGVDHLGDLNHENREAPTRIVLFVDCLLDEVGPGPELEDEVAITILHEVGHYFGLDEEDMERLGLD